jgi:sphinganine-1-phosphate aldolase
MGASMLGCPSAVGTLTSGGTESLLLAVKTYRDYAVAIGRIAETDVGEVVLPRTAHGAFMKACSYFRLKPVVVDVDASFVADLAAMRRAMTSRTVLLVASAPQYPHGVLDPIEAIAALGKERGAAAMRLSF